MVRKDRLLSLAAFLGLAICVGFSIACLGGDGGGGGGGASPAPSIPPSEPFLDGFAAELIQQDAEGALGYVLPSIQDDYQDIFTALGLPGMQEMGLSLQGATLLSETDGWAVYEATYTMADGELVRSRFFMVYDEQTSSWKVAQ